MDTQEELKSAKIRVSPWLAFDLTDSNLSTIFLPVPPCAVDQLSPSIPDESRPASLVMAVTDF